MPPLPPPTPGVAPRGDSLHPPVAFLEMFRSPDQDDEAAPLLGGLNDTYRARRVSGQPWPARAAAFLRRRVERAVPFVAWSREYLGVSPPVLLASAPGADDGGDEEPLEAWDALPWWRRGLWTRYLRGDTIAGLTVAVMVVPQAMAYATLASVPPIYGLYSLLVPIAVYALCGTSREMSIGPVAVNALLLTSSLEPHVAHLPKHDRLPRYLDLLFTTTFLTGAFSLAMGLLRVGMAVDFVSPAVLMGFSLGSEVLIAASQVEPLLGFSTGPPEPYLVPQLVRTFSHIGRTEPAAVSVGLVSLFLLLTLGRWKRTAWIPRPLFVTASAAIAAFLISSRTTWPIPVVGAVPGGFPAPVVPALDWPTVEACLVPSFLLALLGFMQSISVALKFAEKRGYAVRANQELAALGLCHLLSAFTRAFDATGSYSRTSVNANAGARTQVAGIVLLAAVAATLAFLTPLFYFIPKSALAAVVIAAVVGMFEPAAFAQLYRTRRSDFAVAVLTALVTTFTNTQWGLLSGIAISLLITLLRAAKPHHAVLGLVLVPGHPSLRAYRNVRRYRDAVQVPGVLVWRFDGALWFASAGHFRSKLAKAIERRGREERVRAVVLDMSAVPDADAAGAQALLKLNAALKARRIALFLAACRGPLRDTLWRATGGQIFGRRAKGGTVLVEPTGQQRGPLARMPSPLPGIRRSASPEPESDGSGESEPETEAATPPADEDERLGDMALFAGRQIHPGELYLESFFLSVDAAVDHAKAMVERQKRAEERRATLRAGTVGALGAEAA